MTRRLCVPVLVLLGIGAPTLAAQTSIYGTSGIGFPGRGESMRTVALGGGFAAFDPFSQVNPAAAAVIPRVSAMAAISNEFRSFSVAGQTTNGLKTTRFPLGFVGGRLGHLPVGFSGSFATYADRSYDFTATDTLQLRGVPVPVADRLASDGAIADVGGAIGWAPVSRIDIGVGLHLISGSSKLTARRTFGDSSYQNYVDTSEATFSARGIGGGVIVGLLPGVRLAGAVRADGRLRSQVDSGAVKHVALPVTVTGGLQVVARGVLHWSTTVIWHSWSRAAADLAGSGSAAFDTWDIGSGIELGGSEAGGSPFPLRVGFRYAQLPFAPTGTSQPHETTLAAGTGINFAGSRGTIDLALERVWRTGGGASEHAWQLGFGMTVRP